MSSDLEKNLGPAKTSSKPSVASATGLNLTLNEQDANQQYKAAGQSWVIKAISSNENNFSLLMTSTGVQCKNKTKANITYTSCGSAANGSEGW